MESRIRRLISNRRGKASIPATDPYIQSAPSQPTSTTNTNPSPSYQPLNRSLRDDHAEQSRGLSLISVSYDRVASGVAPVFGIKPEKGNGPVKLQTSRRLSSGEVLVVPQDDGSVLEDLREGDYIVGHRRAWETQTKIPPRSPLRLGSRSPATSVSTAQTPDLARMSDGASNISWSSPPARCSSAQSNLFNQSSDLHHKNETCVSSNLKAIDENCQSHDSCDPSCASYTPAGPNEAPNTIISALWRAEYNRLVKLYGKDGVDGDMARLQLQLDQHPSLHPTPAATPAVLALDPLPPPGYDRRSFESKRSSGTSGRSSSYYSDASSLGRTSMVSSYAASSVYTMPTTASEMDPPKAGEDIRRMVQEMRSTYLRALETQTPSIAKSRSVNKKKRRPKATKSPLIQSSRMTPSPVIDRQTWHGDEGAPLSSTTEVPKRRAASSPVTGLGISPSEEVVIVSELSSPPPPPPPKTELHRADSMTLGGLMGEPRARKEATQHEVTPVLSSDEEETSTSPCSPDVDDWAQFDIPEFNMSLNVFDHGESRLSSLPKEDSKQSRLLPPAAAVGRQSHFSTIFSGY